jgi:ATP-dependent DNA helicase DinG
MLDEKIKNEIQVAYSKLLEEKDYRARYCQKLMIAEIARTLGAIESDGEGKRTPGPHIAVIEAGTGTGKTIAYALACIPVARSLGKSLVISTATIALQEQIVFTDLPDIRQHAHLDFSFALAKGRRRYLCLSRLDKLLEDTQSMNHSLALYDDEIAEFTDEETRQLYQRMVDQLSRGDWDGDRDSWAENIDDVVWFTVTTDHAQCTGRKCSHYSNCYFYKAREKIHNVDCIVTNHDLVLSDLVMGGGTVLPEPENTIYIFDEGHHLPDKAINHFTHFGGLTASQNWLEQLPDALRRMLEQTESNVILPEPLPGIEKLVASLVELLQLIGSMLEELIETDDALSRSSLYAGREQYRFIGGRVGEPIRETSAELSRRFSRLHSLFSSIAEGLSDHLAGESAIDPAVLEEWFSITSAMSSRAEAITLLWADYAREDESHLPPRARWINIREGSGDLQVNSSPIMVDRILQDTLWDRCFGAVITSATLSVGTDFSRFQRQAGISSDNHFSALPSPFDYQNQARLYIPPLRADPKDPVAHTQAVIEILPGLLENELGALVLFSSWKQMFSVLEGLETRFRERVLPQGDLSKIELLRRHKSRIDAGEASVIFGLASFSEGIDLPGRYCDHVVIVKIPFSVPDDPVGATLGEWIDQQGGNAFREISIPDAILRLVQASGRLLRTEHDSGVVSLLDRRVVTQWYGQLILGALPPFRRDIG